MTRVFILARDYREACDIARLAGLQPHQWSALATHNLRGHRGVPLLATGDHCWRDSRGDALELSQNILVSDCKVTYVPCPPEWRDSSFMLPEGWDEPKIYPRIGKPAPPDPGFECEEPEMVIWRRVGSWIRRIWR